MNIWPGKPYPLGATWDGAGVNFALFSENATAVELCLFHVGDPGRETARIQLGEHTDQVWHAYLPQVRPGQLYAYRVHGPDAPEEGHRFDATRLLLDPYAKAIAGTFESRDEPPRAAVIDQAFSWGDDVPPRIPWHETLIYELHVKGFTARHPDVPWETRGTFAGLTAPAVLDYLRSLGVTAVELMPVHQALTEPRLSKRGLTNYWGYNSIGYFAPDARFSCSGLLGQQVAEFKSMVRTLHREGIEVILDVVYNHTGEGNHEGPTVCFRGIDNASYYRLQEKDRRLYVDYTGCGNTLNVMHPRVLQLIMDSLRYWVLEMHVDGFRFDLASALARELHDVDRLGAFFDIIHQDPVLSQVKLIAEPWDLGEGGYQVGNFPVLWAEWNGKYRDTIRRYWRGDEGQVSDLAYRLTGSSDLYEQTGRRPYASINFVTAHDGYTLRDLVSFEEKHNEANLEENRDGSDENLSWNCGVEGPTDDPEILALRARQVRNFLATMIVSHGVPMLVAGDEIGRTQRGNNNAYCQDSELSWLDWSLDPEREDLLEFTRFAIRLFHRHPVIRRQKFFRGQRVNNSRKKDIVWIRPDSRAMENEDWSDPETLCLGARLEGDAIDEVDERGTLVEDDTMLILLNARPEPVPFTMPGDPLEARWELVLDTRDARGKRRHPPVAGGEAYELAAHSLALLRLVLA